MCRKRVSTLTNSEAEKIRIADNEQDVVAGGCKV